MVFNEAPYTYALHISAMEYATASVKIQTASQPHIMTGGPPVSTPIIRTPLNAVQDVTILKENPTIPTRPKLRFSSTCRQLEPQHVNSIHIPCVYPNCASTASSSSNTSTFFSGSEFGVVDISRNPIGQRKTLSFPKSFEITRLNAAGTRWTIHARNNRLSRQCHRNGHA